MNTFLPTIENMSTHILWSKYDPQVKTQKERSGIIILFDGVEWKRLNFDRNERVKSKK